MSTRRDDKVRRGVGRRRGFSVESLERRALLTTASETFTGPSLTHLINEAKQGQNTAPAVITKMVTALESQLLSGPLADLKSGAVTPNGFITESQGLEASFEQNLLEQKLAAHFPKIDIDQLLRLQGQAVVADLIAENQEASVGLIAGTSLPSTFQTTIESLTSGPIQAIGTSKSALTAATKSFRNELYTLSNDLTAGSLTLAQFNTTLGAEAEAYRGQIHAAIQVSDPTDSGHTDTKINALENAVGSISESTPANAASQVATAIKTFVSSVLDTTGIFGTKGAFSKAPRNVTQHPAAAGRQLASIITGVSGNTGADGTASLTATLTMANGSPLMGQAVAFTVDGAFAGVGFTNFVGVATLSEIPTSDAIGLDPSGVVASFASNTSFLASRSFGDLTVNQISTTVTNVSGSGIFGGPETLTATLTDLSTNLGLAGQPVSFSVDGKALGTANTDANGLATLTGVTTANGAGTDTGGVVASFAGFGSLASSSGSGNLNISQAGTLITTVAGTAGVGGTASLSATLTSTVTNQPVAGETISFTLDGTSAGTAVTNSSGVATLTGVATSQGVGTDTGGVVASFVGDANYTAAASVTGNLVVSLNATSLISVSGGATLGGTANLTATLINATSGLNLSGKTVSFTLDGKSVGTAVTNSTGSANLTGIATTQGVGTDTGGVVASFAGDASNAATTTTGNLVVSQGSTTISNTSGSAAVGGTAILTATLTSNLDGSPLSGQVISFSLDGKSAGTAVTNGSGVATLTGVATTQGAGTDSGGVVATFAGDTNYSTSIATGNLVVAAHGSTLGNVMGNATFGGTATVSAVLTDPATSQGIAGQTVSFTLDGKSVGTSVTNSAGLATLAGLATTDSVGTNANVVVAAFAGNATYAAANATGDLNVIKAATTLGAVGGTAAFGQTATLVATLTSSVTSQAIAGQTVTFKLDGTSVGTAVTNESGVATLAGVNNTQGIGTDTGGVVASFAGSTSYDATTTTGNLVVTANATTIGEVSGNAVFGGTATLFATLTNPATGQGVAGKEVAFSLDDALVGTAVTNASGIASLSGVVTTNAGGTDVGGVVAKFAGDSTYAASNGTGNLVVTAANSTTTNVSGFAYYGGTATLTATLDSSVTNQGITGQTVTFRFNGTMVGTAVTDADGTATLTDVSTLTGQSHTFQPAGTDTGAVTASFAGDLSVNASTGTGDVIISKASTVLSSVRGTAPYGGTAVLTAILSSPDTGQIFGAEPVTFTLDGTPVGTASTENGTATLGSVPTTNPAGTDTDGILVNFAGDSNYLAAASVSGDLVVTKADTAFTSVTGTAVFGGTATLTAGLSSTVTNQPIAGQIVSFKLDGTAVGTAVTDANGNATLTGVATSDPVGTNQGAVTVSYAGDSNYNLNGGSGSALIVSQAGTTLTNVSGTSNVGGPATLTATLMSSVTDLPIAGQTVTFKLDGTSVGTAVTDSNGVATLTGAPTTDAAGTDTGGVVVNYGGNTDYLTSNGTGDLTVTGFV